MSLATAHPISARLRWWSTIFGIGSYDWLMSAVTASLQSYFGTVERENLLVEKDVFGVLTYIIGGEVLFWVLLLGGASIRYLLGWRTISTGLLIATPVVDLAIIALTYVDLAGGAPSDFSHGLAAFYVGFSIVFGPEVIARFDRRFARRHTDLTENQLPTVPRRTAIAYWCRCLLASAITIVLLVIGMLVAGWADSFWLIYWIVVAVSTAGLWALIGPVRERRGRT